MKVCTTQKRDMKLKGKTMSKQYTFIGSADERTIFNRECGRLRIKTEATAGNSTTATNLTDKQFETVHNLAKAIIVK